MNSICDGRTIKNSLAVGILALTSIFVAAVKPYAHADATAADTESVLVYSSITVTVNKSVVLRLPKKASRVSVTQPQIAEAIVVAPDQVLINGKAVGTTSLVVWFEDNKTREKQNSASNNSKNMLTELALFVKYFDCLQPRHALVKHAGFEEFDNLLGPRVTAKEIVEDLEAASE